MRISSLSPLGPLGPLVLALVASSACSAPSSTSAPAGRVPTSPGDPDAVVSFWHERFDAPSLDWVAPLGHEDDLARIYRVVHEPSGSFLHARHDVRPGQPQKPPPAIHYGRAWEEAPPPLDQVRSLSWKWRVHQHPDVNDDPWLDVAASLYVVVKQPSLLWNGKGFKFGWLAKPGPSDTSQHGLLQLPLRHDAASDEWRTERVDLCALYREHFGPCEGQFVRYVGVTTDADGTKSVADADYGEFELELTTAPAR